jgi:cell division protein FtsL
MLLVGVVAVVAIGLVRVVQSSDATSTNFEIQALQEQRLDWLTRVQQLEAEVSVQTSLQRIEGEARGRLGMVPGGDAERVTVGMPLPEQSLAPGDATRADEEDEGGGGSWWWHDLDDLLPFR